MTTMVTEPRRPYRPEADAPLPTWPFTLMFAALPLWFLVGLSGFMWVVLAAPMLASLSRRRDLVLPARFMWWVLLCAAVLCSVVSIDSAGRFVGWLLRFGYYIGAAITMIYVLNGRSSLTVWKVVRVMVYLWLATVAGGYLAFVLGDLKFASPVAYVMPGVLRENEFVTTLITPSFAEIQDIIGFPIPRPKAPFPYTNSWGSMLGLLTPFALIALRDTRVGLSPRLLKVALIAAIIPGVVSLNRGLWISLGVGVAYVTLRLGAAGQSRALRNAIIALTGLAIVIFVTPLGDLIITRFATGHSDSDRLQMVTSALRGAMERPVFGWGGPRPNERNLPSVGTHGQAWFVVFSYGFTGMVGYFGAFASWAWMTRRQLSITGLWCHTVVVIGLVQAFFYLHVPHQMYTMMVAAALAIRLRNEEQPVMVHSHDFAAPVPA